MVKSLVSKLSSASNISLASTLSSVGVGHGSSSSTQETNYAKHRNDPGRFFGDGVQFKAKLIGILEVGEARGDRMCQEALQDLKMAIRAAGEHKQRITIHVTIDGLRLRDEKTGDSLYHHPVHKISFIAQDMTDSRAFGYIFGSPDSGHRFFGIKTDKAASQVVLAMRDLFQVVFELKKKEIELARQQIQSKSIHEHHLASLSSLKSASGIGGGHNDLSGSSAGISGGGGGGSGSSGIGLSTLSGLGGGGGVGERGGVSGGSGSGALAALSRLESCLDAIGAAAKELSPESVADLVDLEQELSSIQRGITQMERITPNDPAQPHSQSGGGSKDEDPFGDSFTNFPQAYNLLPPPESGRSRNKPSNKPTDALTSSAGSGVSNNNAAATLLSPATTTGERTSPTTLQVAAADEDDSWLNELEAQSDVFETTTKANTNVGIGIGGVGSSVGLVSGGLPLAPLAASESTSTPTQQLSENSAIEMDSGMAAASLPLDLEQYSSALRSTKSDAFTDLDPLGTGRTRPYVDKKYFFQELKNPPKKVLKDLSANSGNTIMTATATVTSTPPLTFPSGEIAPTQSHQSYKMAAAVVDEFLNNKDGLFDATSATLGLATTATSTSSAILAVTAKTDANLTTNNKPPTATDPLAAGADAGSLMPGEAIMLPRDTDPFSPTRKKSDPFQEGDIFAKLDPFDVEFASSTTNTATLAAVKPPNAPNDVMQRGTSPTRRSGAAVNEVFNGPLQVSLPPERSISPSSSSNMHGAYWKGAERSVSPTFTGTNNSSIRSRPTPSNAAALATPSSVLKQQTVDVISSISNKKMPHLFGQTRFSKRGGDSAVNMRRLQESDSLSENEAAPEPPPRPDSALHVEPPPLPPKKQFNDIVIRPRVTSGNAVPPSMPSNSLSTLSSSNRYEFISSATLTKQNSIASVAPDVPPIPLPSRRIGRSDGSYPGPGRPRKPGHTDDDYLAPLGINNSTGGSGDAIGAVDVPPLLPPPTQVSTRGRTQRQQSFKAHELYENKSEILQQQQQQQQQDTVTEESAAIIPDITLSQLLTLGIDELAAKLNVPTSKLSTMTLVELTSYLSEFIEKSNNKPTPKASASAATARQSASPKTKSSLNTTTSERSSVFKVNFDAQSTFVAKFDDTFGEDLPAASQSYRDKARGKIDGDRSDDTFVANFEQFNEPPVAPPILTKAGGAPSVPSADRYAVFREIIDQELQIQKENVDLMVMSDMPTPPPMPSSTSADHSELIDASVETIGEAEMQANVSGYGLHYQPPIDDDFLGTQPGTQHQAPPPTVKIDTKITEVVAQAKDRYAALRDIILVENLFDKKPSASTLSSQEKDYQGQDTTEFSDEFTEDQDVKQIMKNRASSGGDRLLDSRGLPAEPSSSVVTIGDGDDDEDVDVDDEEDDEEDDDDAGGESSLDSNDKETGGTARRAAQDQYEKLSTSNQQLDMDQLSGIERGSKSSDAVATRSNSNLLNIGKQDNKYLTVSPGAATTISCLSASKDDLEIDELMQRAISNLSLDSRERISPATSAMATTRSTSAMLTSTQSPIPASVITSATSAKKSLSAKQRSPISLSAAASATSSNGQMQQKSPQISPITAPLAAVSNLIDTATKQLNAAAGADDDAVMMVPVGRKGARKEAWATFDSPKTGFADTSSHEKRSGSTRPAGAPKTALSKPSSAAALHLPPAPPSNTSQNDTAESPCSSDPRDDGWSKGRRGWPKAKERHQQTSSSSRDLSPWDDESADYVKQQKRMMALQAPPIGQGHHQADRHGYYMRHARRMNSCDEDYEYEEEFNSRRDQRKFKQGLSRSRDNFDLDSPSWYHHHGSAHHNTWSPQDIEQATTAAAASRMRAFERSAYERQTYGPPMYDKRGISTASYDRRGGGVGGGYEKRKYYRDYGPPPPLPPPSLTRPSYEFNEYGERDRDREIDRYREPPKMGRRVDYENVYDAGSSSRSRADYGMYERERKSFDRDSVESFESATRRRRSFGSGDVYGSLESREEFRERYMGGGIGGDLKSRSLRKNIKLRATGDIDYEQDSENDYHHQQRARGAGGVGVAGVNAVGGGAGGALDARSLQRPSQLVSGSSGNMSRMRKSSGSSPWDGEEPPLPGQKVAWKRPGSATESERRLAESRRVASAATAAALGQTPSGSDGEKERRFRKKTRIRGKDYVPSSAIAGVPNSRYGSAYGEHDVDDDNDDDDANDEYDDEDYVDEEYDEPPTDEDKFERLNRRRHEMHQRMMESERRQHAMGPKALKASSSSSAAAAKRYQQQQQHHHQQQQQHHHHHRHNVAASSNIAAAAAAGRASYELDDYDEQTPTPRSIASSVAASSAHPTSGSGVGIGGGSTKFSFDGGGFESDFNQNSPPPAPAGAVSSCTSTPAATTTSAASVSGVSATAKSSFRFSNDFSEREKMHFMMPQNSTSVSSLQQFEMDTVTATAVAATSPSSATHTQKLRFDDKVKISQFDDAAFEDDFAKAPFDFSKNEEQWQQHSAANEPSTTTTTATTTIAAPLNAGGGVGFTVGTIAAPITAKKQNLRNSKLQQRQQELIKKSESINIFAKKAEDPFEDDEFFSSAPVPINESKTPEINTSGNNTINNNNKNNSNNNGFQWESENNFAKFDENM